SSFGSMFRFHRSPSSKGLDLLLYHALQRGIYIWEARGCFLSTAHTNEDVDLLVHSMEHGLEKLRDGGFVAGPSGIAISAQDLDRSGRLEPVRQGTITHQVIPLTAPLRQLWVHAQLSKGASLAYNELLALRLRGELNLARLRGAVQRLIARHEALRTTID